MTQPQIKITNLNIQSLGPIQSLNLPEQGLGWDGKFPDVMLIGGVNGSGKTTLLEFLFNAFEALEHEVFSGLIPMLPLPLERKEIRKGESVLGFSLEFLGKSWMIQYRANLAEGWRFQAGDSMNALHGFVQKSQLPSVVYLPSERRNLFVFTEKAKAFSEVEEPKGFVQRWQAPSGWKSSLEAKLYNARWKDLNLKEEGHPEKAIYFSTYAKAFSDFWGGAKQLIWSEGELFVEIPKNHERHSLAELSSGEKQMMVLVSELLMRWKPGSLILIDEPELHLHTAWQTRFWELLLRWQQERGGQVIVATQSNHLFRIAEPSSVVLLGSNPL